MRPRTRATLSVNRFNYVMECQDTALVCALLLRKQYDTGLALEPVWTFHGGRSRAILIPATIVAAI